MSVVYLTCTALRMHKVWVYKPHSNGLVIAEIGRLLNVAAVRTSPICIDPLYPAGKLE